MLRVSNAEPVKISGSRIANTFWGKSWCENLERYSDFANRLPRGRTYVRNGSVVDLQINKGKIKALVAGSEVYKVTITIDTLTAALWKQPVAASSVASTTATTPPNLDDVIPLLTASHLRSDRPRDAASAPRAR